MMVETILESSQDFGMSNGALPQWKRELLQRRAARARPPPAPAPPAPAPPPSEEDEELRYGPGIVKRLKSRYLSLALREAPRRRPSVLRRAASLEHLLDERPPPAPRATARPARPASLVAPPHAALAAAPPRRDSVKRARSVDALSRLDARDEPAPPPPLQPPPAPPPPPPCPPPPLPRTLRPPRRPRPLLREAERPPADVVRSTLRKFESAPARRAAPAARVSAVLRGLEAAPRSSTPEPRARSPSPAAADLSAIDEPEGAAGPAPAETRPVSRAALDGIARAGSTVRYSFEAGARGSHLPPLAAANPVLLGRARASASPRRVGVIRPMPAPAVERRASSPPPTADGADEVDEKVEEALGTTAPPPPEAESPPRKEPPPPTVAVEPVPRPPPEERSGPALNGHGPARAGRSRIGAAGIERAWSGAGGAWGARRARAPAPASTSVVFNFSDRKEVPDYIENDGIVLRASRRNRFKAGEAGIVVLRAEALAASSDSDEEARPPSPCSVRFVNDNVLINGRSSMAARPAGDRAARLKLQFDDSLTRTFEYPSETSLSEPAAPAGPPAGPPAAALLVSPSLSQYTPSKTCADAFALGVARPHREAEAPPAPPPSPPPSPEGDARPCAAESARSWSEARTLATDLLF